MALSKPQQTIADNSKRFRVVIAGRRFGKTTLAIREICKVAREPNKDVYYIAPTYRQAKAVAWRKLKHKLQDLKWAKKVNETELSIQLKNNSVISLKGADNPDSLRGVSLSAAVFDEFAFMDPETWELVIRPALADQEGSALFITTPVGKNNWAYDLFCMHEKFGDDWASFQYTTIAGGNVSEREIEAAREQMDPRTYRQEFEASFENYGNRVAYAFDRSRHVRDTTEVKQRVGVKNLEVGVDFNNSPITAAIMVRDKDCLYQIDEVCINDSHTQELADEIKRRYPDSKITVYPDPAGRQRKTSANGQTDFTILQNAGFIVKAPLAHNQVRDRVNSMNSRLMTQSGQIHYWVDPKCKHTIESFEKFAYKEGTQQPDKTQGFDHMFDAVSYAVDYLFPLKRKVEMPSPQRFGHQIQ